MSTAKAGSNNHMYGKAGDLNPFFGQTHSAETKAKMSLANYGRAHSAETKAKMSVVRKGIAKTEETKAKISLVKGSSIFVYNLDGSLVNTFCSARKASRRDSSGMQSLLKINLAGEFEMLSSNNIKLLF